MQRKILILILLILPFVQVFSQNRQIDFRDPAINSSNEVVASLVFPGPQGDDHNVLIRGQADTLSVEALTIYPEQAFYFPERDELMIYNHFGTFGYRNGIWQEDNSGDAFSSGGALSPLPLIPRVPSPDGKYTAYVAEDERGMVSLVLFDRERGTKTTVTSSLKAEYIREMVKWSPDSKYFIYRRGRELYYFSIDQYLSGRIPAESFRKTGFQDIQSVQWKEGNYLYVLKDRYLYRVHSSEFFTRAFYSEPFRRGSVHGRLPVSYDPVFDSWSLDEKGRNIVLIKNGETAFVLPLLVETSTGPVIQTPVLTAEYGTAFVQAEWLSDGSLLVRSRKIGGCEGRVYRYGLSGEFTLLADSVSLISVSPDRTEFALPGPVGAGIYRTGSDSPFLSFDREEILDLKWGRDGYILLGKNTISLSGSSSSQLLALASVDRAGYSAAGDLIAESGENQYRYDEALQWEPLKGAAEIAEPRQGNSSFRIYLEKQSEGWFASSLKIRDVESYNTKDLIPLYLRGDGYTVPRQLRPESSGNPWYFDHGTNTDRKEISLVINAVDNAEGSSGLLDLLSRYGVPATFFLNGDFINSNPVETKIIAESGHTVGSLFYTMFDMAGSGYQIDKDFLKKGLARNEDDYFIATGQEMSMLWHTPGYYINSEILETSASMQYVFIGTDIPVEDRPGPRVSGSYDAVAEAEKLIMRVRPGSIVTLTLGGGAGQDEYLFKALPMIFDHLIRDGFTFVDLQEMMNASR